MGMSLTIKLHAYISDSIALLLEPDQLLWSYNRHLDQHFIQIEVLRKGNPKETQHKYWLKSS